MSTHPTPAPGAPTGAPPTGPRTVVVVGAQPRMAHGQHQLGMLRAAAADLGVRLVELSSDAVRAAVAGGGSCAPLPAGDLGYVCFREDHTLDTARLDPRGNDPDAVACIRKKDRARAVLRAAGLDQPLTGHAPEDVPGPWVVKPVEGSGSRGVSIHHDAAGARRALAATPGSFVESFVEGQEFSVEGFLHDGQLTVFGVTDKHLDAAGIVELGHEYPARRVAASEAAIVAALRRAVSAWGLRAGIVHAEGWVTPDGRIILGEAHVRPGGDFIHLLVSAVHGDNIFRPLVAAAAGVPTPPFPGQQQGVRAAVRYLTARPGTVAHIHGVQEALRSPGIIAGSVDLAPGDTIATATDSTGRIGCLVARATGGQDPQVVLDRALAHIRIDYAAP
ncbi:hypothetical protein C1Y63_05415 [Corynebacterium sp. 13CS0277]|uniref:ATP-grasp domain-containing protein n=1 Tax=Corynebacterium sp. 13CS0277 TaxID=2071994 RepID=UPI000D0481C9|nr:ATP-grasp domain-containing protein [Corynebacterium sp. 13CS0277]PRQ11617.1 hypothetical protein C1Y63_05415 [Corynebacterium sp. 13CS0277]